MRGLTLNYYSDQSLLPAINNAIKESKEHLSPFNSGYMTITQDIIDEHGFELIGRLPTSDDEVVISECNYKFFKLVGYKDEEGNEYDITSYDDIIGRKVRAHDLTVTGILKTSCDRACYFTHPYNDNWKDISYSEIYSLERDELFHEKYFVTEGFVISHMDEYYNIDDTYVLFRVPESKREMKRIAKLVLTYNKQGMVRSGVFYKFKAWTDNGEVSSLYLMTDWYQNIIALAKPYSIICLYLGIVFFIFTAVFMINFLTASIRSQTKQIGIISALGGDFKGIYTLYAISSAIICGIIYVLSLPIVGIGIGKLNASAWMPNPIWSAERAAYTVKLLSLNIWTILGMLALVMVTALLGTLIALRKYRKLTPADIIRKGTD